MQRLTKMDEIQSLLETDAKQPYLFFKHSTTCPISSDAWQEVESFAQTEVGSSLSYYFIHVGEDRPLSNYVEEYLQIKHESPQAFLIHEGNVVWHDSHRRITQAVLEEKVTSL